jgi:hypothetical protein
MQEGLEGDQQSNSVISTSVIAVAIFILIRQAMCNHTCFLNLVTSWPLYFSRITTSFTVETAQKKKKKKLSETKVEKRATRGKRRWLTDRA